METKVQLTHPRGKRAISMDKVKYDLIKKPLLQFLKSKKEGTHKEMYQAIMEDFKKNKIKFSGAVEWHLEWVKMDLEATHVIKRIPGTAPIKFTLA